MKTTGTDMSNYRKFTHESVIQTRAVTVKLTGHEFTEPRQLSTEEYVIETALIEGWIARRDRMRAYRNGRKIFDILDAKQSVKDNASRWNYFDLQSGPQVYLQPIKRIHVTDVDGYMVERFNGQTRERAAGIHFILQSAEFTNDLCMIDTKMPNKHEYTLIGELALGPAANSLT